MDMLKTASDVHAGSYTLTTTLLGTPVQLLVNANSSSASHMAATQYMPAEVQSERENGAGK